MLEQKRPLENYIGASWLAQQCEVSRGVIHDYAVRKKLRYYLFMGIRYLERNDAIALVKYLIQQQHEINLPKIVGAIENYHSRTKILST
ncbi:MAG: hypothetical protein GVY17_06520 [Cyanobacteria bacterium]|jgi:hypothetical protein|nr:hypothetical protein [Cyanobacteria bacterium GSL.Bin21]